jgi:two-component system sensor histidine kinase TctE
MSADFSLRGALTRRLLIALMLLGGSGATATYLLTNSYAGVAYDRALFDSAIALAKQLIVVDGRARLDLPPQAKSVLLADQSDKVVFRAVDLGHARVLDENIDLGAWPANLEPGAAPDYRDVASPWGMLRVVAIEQQLANGERVLVEVGETRNKRDALTRNIVLGLALLVIAMVAMTIVVVRRGTATALAPLARLEIEAASRSVDNLAPLSLQGAPREVLGLIKAINHLMARLEDAIGLQLRFTANVAHQLRTPLAGVRLQAQLGVKSGEVEVQRDALLQIERDAVRTSHMVDQLLSLAKAETEAQATAVRVDLAELGMTVVGRYVRMALEKGIDLGFDGDRHGAFVLGYPALLEEMAGNLVDNAIRYTQAGGRVTVAVHAKGETCELAVSDDGPGIAPEARAQVFERFYRSDTSHGEGAGLGLAIVHEIAERHRATVRIEDGEGGRGSCFRLCFGALRKPG